MSSNKIKVKLDDGTIGTVSKFIVDDVNEFDSEREAIKFIKDKALN